MSVLDSDVLAKHFHVAIELRRQRIHLLIAAFAVGKRLVLVLRHLFGAQHLQQRDVLFLGIAQLVLDARKTLRNFCAFFGLPAAVAPKDEVQRQREDEKDEASDQASANDRIVACRHVSFPSEKWGRKSRLSG